MSARQRVTLLCLSLLLAVPWVLIVAHVEVPAALQGGLARAAAVYGFFFVLCGASWLAHRVANEEVSDAALAWMGCLLFAAGGLFYGNYQADDAAISWSFAERFAAGQGFSLNPGDSPVEGFSNPTLVAYMIVVHALGIPVHGASKLAGLLCGLTTLWFSYRIMRRHLGCSGRVAAMAVWWIAACTSFTYWAVAGLENPLLALFLVAAIERGAAESEREARLPWASAVLMLCAALTRPEGLGYVLGFGAARVAYGLLQGRRMGHLGWFAIALLPYLGLEVLRIAYFGVPLPNTFYAKVPEFRSLRYVFDKHVMAALTYLLNWLVSYGLSIGAALGVFALVRFRRPQSVRPGLWLTLAGLLSAIGFIFVSGGDFYTAGRFLAHAVPLAVMLGASGAQLAVDFLNQGEKAPPSANAIGTVAAGTLGLHLLVNVFGALSTPNEVGVPLQRIADRGQYFAAMARQARIVDPSLMDVDLGGTSYGTGLRVHDLGGLGDHEVAMAMRENRFGREFVQAYMFELRKPTFLHFHEPWTSMSGVDTCDGLRDYLELGQVSYRPFFKKPQMPLPTERNFVRLEAITDPSAAESAQMTSCGCVSVLSATRQQGGLARIVFRLDRQEPGAPPVFRADERLVPLLYGWTTFDHLPTGLPLVQYIELPTSASLSIEAAGSRAAIL